MSDQHTAATDDREHTPALDRQTPVRPPGPADDGRATAPIIIDLGKRRRRLIEQLTRGEGPLMNEVHEVIDDVRAELSDDLDGRILVPLVIVCRPKRRRRLRLFPVP